jgi:hypothetical protein
MSLLVAKIVLSGLVIDWRLAGAPTSLSPLLVNATIEGVVLLPSELGITFATLFSITATHELVVPKSIPTIWDEVLRSEKKDFSLFTNIIYNYGFIRY